MRVVIRELEWVPNSAPPPHRWDLDVPWNRIRYQVLLHKGQFVPLRLDSRKIDNTWKRLSEKGFWVLADAIKICEDVYLGRVR